MVNIKEIKCCKCDATAKITKSLNYECTRCQCVTYSDDIINKYAKIAFECIRDKIYNKPNNSNNQNNSNDQNKNIYNTLPPKSKWFALGLCILGLISPCAGIHRLYVGKIGSGVIYMLTGGLFSIGTIIDIVFISKNIFLDRDGNNLI